MPLSIPVLIVIFYNRGHWSFAGQLTPDLKGTCGRAFSTNHPLDSTRTSCKPLASLPHKAACPAVTVGRSFMLVPQSSPPSSAVTEQLCTADPFLRNGERGSQPPACPSCSPRSSSLLPLLPQGLSLAQSSGNSRRKPGTLLPSSRVWQTAQGCRMWQVVSRAALGLGNIRGKPRLSPRGSRGICFWFDSFPSSN